MKNIITVTNLPDAVQQHAGAFVLWRLSGTTNVRRLNDVWLDAALPLDLLPEAPSPEVAFSRAVKEHAAGRVSAARLDDGGWALTAKRNTRDEKGSDVEFATELRVWLREDERIRFEPEHDWRCEKIRQDFVFNQRELSATDISTWLVKRVKELEAVPLRDTGGVYFVPHRSMAVWRDICSVIREVSDHKIFNVTALESDADALALIADGIAQEAASLVAKMDEIIAKAKIGERGLGARKEELQVFEGKLKRYEQLLGTKLGAIREQLEAVDEKVNLALVAAEAERTK